MSKAPTGVPADELTVIARRVLLDGLTALRPHLPAITVVGAQAVHLRTPGANLGSSAFTSDGDLSIDPNLIESEPLLEEALRCAGFTLMSPRHPGLWAMPVEIGGKQVSIELDLLVGASFITEKSKRSAPMPPHDRRAAMKVPGLEVAAIDRSELDISSLDPDDQRSVSAFVVGPVALLVAKAFKIGDRIQDKRSDRLADKDAADVFRLMMVTRADVVATSFGALVADDRVGEQARTGLQKLRELFGGPATSGTNMAVAALAGDVPERQVRALAPAFVGRLAEI